MARPKKEESAPRLSDEELEYYGELYLGCGIREAGVDFENFLINPEYYLRKYAKGRWRIGRGSGRRKGLLRLPWLGRATRPVPD
jgi:hypothetical protein